MSGGEGPVTAEQPAWLLAEEMRGKPRGWYWAEYPGQWIWYSPERHQEEGIFHGNTRYHDLLAKRYWGPWEKPPEPQPKPAAKVLALTLGDPKQTMLLYRNPRRSELLALAVHHGLLSVLLNGPDAFVWKAEASHQDGPPGHLDFPKSLDLDRTRVVEALLADQGIDASDALFLTVDITPMPNSESIHINIKTPLDGDLEEIINHPGVVEWFNRT